MGPSVAFEILINSELKNYYQLLHLDVKANASLDTLGKWGFKKIFSNLTIYKNLYTLLKNEKPDLVLIPISQATIGFVKDSVFILLCRLTQTRCLVQLRGSDFKRWVDSSGAITQWYVKKVLKFTKGVLVLGNNLKYLFTEYFNDNQIFVAPNGGNYAIPPAIKNGELQVHIIYLANLQSSKGIEDVLQAMVQIENTIPGASRLTVIGAWRKEETRISCLKIVEEHKLPVTFLPPEVSRNKFHHLSLSDIFVFTPREPEGHPWVIVEAMASGLPVISTDQGAIRESVTDNENGFIVPSRDPAAIATKLILLINNTELRNRMGRKSRLLYEEKFTEERMVQNYIRAFDRVIAETV